MQAALVALQEASSQGLQEGQNPGSTRAVEGLKSILPLPAAMLRGCQCPSEDSPSGPNFPKISHDIKVTCKSPFHSEQSLRGTEERVPVWLCG